MAAFTNSPAGGNPAGVVLDASGLSQEARLAIAADLGYSETAFLEDRDGRHLLRYFSPRAEVAFCGHATVATAVALAQRQGPGELTFDTLAGPILVRTQATPAGHSATLTSPPGRSRPAPAELVAGALSALDWSLADLDPELPPHVAHAGNDHLVLNASSRERLALLDYDFDALLALMAQHGLTTIHLSWRQSPVVFHARDPFPVGGVIEDPATGAAAAAFAAYLTAVLGPAGREFTIHQGQDMGRPSLLRITSQEGSDRHEVSGTAVALE